MLEVSESIDTEPAETGETTAELRLLISPEPWLRTFAVNLLDLLITEANETLNLQSAPADFWPDVFVEQKLPWRRFFESGGYHVLALIAIVAGSRFLDLQPRAVAQSTFSHADVVYYTASEYLPPLDTRSANRAPARKADPELSSQPIISLPPESDNRSQTVVAAPGVHLRQDIALPNTVAWAEKPSLPIAPTPLVPASEISRLAPRIEHSIIAPPPEVQRQTQKPIFAPEQAIVAPPPSLDAASNRQLGDLNIGHAAVIAPAPQLTLEAQHSVPRRPGVRGSAPQVIAPPPAVGAGGGNRSQTVLALSLHPAVGAPPVAAAGNRRGTFATAPEGRHGASGSPGGSSGASTPDSGGSGRNSGSKLPAGLYVGKASNSISVNPNLLANARPVRAPLPEGASRLSQEERQVFGGRKIYALSLNMPNLNSSGGSWIIHFTSLKPDSPTGESPSGNAVTEDLSSPVATRKVDPAYPQELMRQNVAGTVILYGVIHADGTVGGVRVLRSVDENLDRFAGEAIAKWRFQPALKNGAPVDVEATFTIPFRPAKSRAAF
jgi:TonB family protein